MESTMDNGGYTGASAYSREVGYGEALKLFFANYIKFEGRSNRGEYWKAVLLLIVINIAVGVVDTILTGSGGVPFLGMIFSLVTLVPSLAIGARRLHDIGKSGWWLLIGLIPLIGAIILIVWFAKKPDPAPNQYG
ncbi:DUF805 domain-containing protein [Ponticoccus alexandrii]|uniref:DUF805 domain-containing protein n=2 Tax=Ponticoccus alexandrii TaxID=1943633 RepID=A0ABX7FAS8_9RHOB|nr:DUF805 domain-containing protein [Ponticoccus alexandrii]